MRMQWLVLGAMAWTLGGCSGPDVKVGETTEEGHLAAAAKERKEARADEAQYEPNAERVTAVGFGGPVGADVAPGILVEVTPTTTHLSDAEQHVARAKKHEAAATLLAKFEDSACEGIPPADRLSCPTLMSDQLTSLPNGIRLQVGQKRVVAVLAYMRCHLAFARVHGYGEESLCAFAVKGVTANASEDRTAVELTSSDPQAVTTLHGLVLAPFKGL